MRVRFGSLLALVLTASFAGCSGDGPNSVATTVQIQPTNAVNLASIGGTQQLTVRVLDQNGDSMAGQLVTWGVTAGTAASVTTGGLVTALANGTATVTATVGTAAGNATVTVDQVPASMVKTAGDNQSAQVGTTLTTPISVRVNDALGVLIAGETVTFAVTSGGGQITPATAVTNSSGIATATWTMGASPGAQAATATSGTQFVTFGAAATGPPGVASGMSAIAGMPANQATLAGGQTNVRPAVRVADGLNAAVSGVVVNFAVTSGGGSLTKAVDTTDAQGIAQVGSWTVGAGANTMTATAAGLPGTTVTFNASGVAPSYHIILEYATTVPSPEAQAAFDTAVAFWQNVIINDVADLPSSNFPNSSCAPAATRAIDDVVIVVRFDSIDGPSNVLGSAGPCFVRNGTSFSVLGAMRFDTADVRNFTTTNRFTGVVKHEMGHVLGIGTLWGSNGSNCLVNGGLADPYFNCARARAAFDSIGGTSYTGTAVGCTGSASNKVPVENVGGAGTRDGHWRDCLFRTELMTGFAEPPGVPTPLSLVTIASLEDLGYVVNYGARETYNQVFTARLNMAAVTQGREALADILRTPIFTMDRQGRVVSILDPR